MAKETIIRLTDDIDGGAADETVSFGVDGHSYEIDLSTKNAAALRKALDKFVGAARPAATKVAVRRRGRVARAAGRGANGVVADPKQVRIWAAQRGIELATRGRVPGSVIEQYLAES